MPTRNAPSPITVNRSPAPAMVGAAFRQLVLVLGPVFVAMGWLPADRIEGIATLVGTVVAFLWGQWKTWSRHDDTVSLAGMVPDEIAKVK